MSEMDFQELVGQATDGAEEDSPARGWSAYSETEFNFLHSHFPGTRNDFSGEVGYEFTARRSFRITRLGRGLTELNQMELRSTATVTLWNTMTKEPIAVLEVGPGSAGLRYSKGYVSVLLPEALLVEEGRTYRLTQTCTAGMQDKWFDGKSRSSPVFKRIGQFVLLSEGKGFYSPTQYAYPVEVDYRLRIGIVTFFLQPLPGSPSPQVDPIILSRDCRVLLASRENKKKAQYRLENKRRRKTYGQKKNRLDFVMTEHQIRKRNDVWIEKRAPLSFRRSLHRDATPCVLDLTVMDQDS